MTEDTTTQTSEIKAKEKSQEDNVVFIGTKPFINYLTSVNMQFEVKGNKEVVIKARGKFITRAVDVAEVIKKRTLGGRGIETKEIKTASEEFENKEGKRINVSTIEITLKKK